MSRALERELATARVAAEDAARIILDFYDRGLGESELKPDQSPVTQADWAAHASIVDRLARDFPDDTIVSEETARDPVCLRARRVWLVDPLDGTRDFLARTDDFAVHIGLVEDGRPVLGVVHVPVQQSTYFAILGGGAFVRDSEGQAAPLACSSQSNLSDFRVAVGRLYIPDNVRAFLDDPSMPWEVVRMGASVKLMALARGQLEVALWLHDKEKLWDTCAPEVIVREAGGVVSDVDGKPLRYREPGFAHSRGIVVSNGACHEEVLARVRPWFRGGGGE